MKTVRYSGYRLDCPQESLFCVAPFSAKAGAISFSLVESAKEDDLKHFKYLKYVLEELTDATTQDLDKHMP